MFITKRHLSRRTFLRGAGVMVGGLPPKRTGQAGMRNSPTTGCWMVWKIPRSSNVRSLVSSIVSSTAPAGMLVVPTIAPASAISARSTAATAAGPNALDRRSRRALIARLARPRRPR